MRLANLTRESVYYFVVERDFAALALFAPCACGRSCYDSTDADHMAGFQRGDRFAKICAAEQRRLMISAILDALRAGEQRALAAAAPPPARAPGK